MNTQCFGAGCIYERRHNKHKHPGNATQGIVYSVYMTSNFQKSKEKKRQREIEREREEKKRTKYLMYEQVTLSFLAERLVLSLPACIPF